MKKNILIYILLIYSLGLAKEISLQKPKVYKGYENIKGWYMSEKLDGIRGYWSGKHLFTKNGYIINAPKWFTKEFPPFELDGELWTKRGDFENIQSIVLDDNPSEQWREIVYKVFEVPHQEGNLTQRLKLAKKYISKNINIIEQIKCKNRDHLESFLKEIETLGGEGVIIKDASLAYFTGRKPYILKVKSFQDMEGEVIGINNGKGKFKNLMGSVTIKLQNGVVFRLGGGFKISDRKNPPYIGSIITFKYYGFTKNGKPKFASFMRTRKKFNLN
jgi:DNA ligase-1